MHKEKIITIMGAVVLGGILVAVIFMMLGKKTENNYSSVPASPTKPSLPYKLSLEPNEVTATVGAKIKFDLTINAFGENINGLDAVLLYDNKAVKPVEANAVSTRFMVPRKMFETDKIVLTALRQIDDDSPTGQETIASIYFMVLKRGQTEISFQFFPGKTIGSTIIRANGSDNILTTTTGAKIIVR